MHENTKTKENRKQAYKLVDTEEQEEEHKMKGKQMDGQKYSHESSNKAKDGKEEEERVHKQKNQRTKRFKSIHGQT